jgi:bifunctional UDP-N-acetylglucosamine pyrophosphorylase/glucosamine-1-phosphate N-acetyltransferase
MRKDDAVSNRPSAVIILAAGEGKRMKSALPKVLHPIAGRSLVGHVIEAAAHLEPEHVVVVVGHGRDVVVEHLAEVAPWVLPVVQEHQRGTGDAVRVAMDELTARGAHMTGPVVVLTGDTPLLTGDTLAGMLAAHDAACTVLTARVSDPSGYGRVVRNLDDVQAIVEERDATEQQHGIDEINSGMYAFDAALLAENLGLLGTDNSQGEEYLTDVIGLLTAAGHRVRGHIAPDPDDIRGVNDRAQLAEAASIMRDRINSRWMLAGVTMADPSSVWIDVDVELEPDVTVLPQTILRGPTAISSGARVGPGTTLVSCEVGTDAEVIHTWAELAVIGDGAQVGPFTYLRPGAVLGAGAKAGAYVEIKNSRVGDGAKVPHLSYVGDAEIGEGSNIGAATVFVNYDGQAKHRTVVGRDVRIGSDSMLVAPVEVGDGAYTAAGSVITEDVPPGAMAVGRAKQRNIDGWVERRRPESASAAAARAAREASGASAKVPSHESSDSVREE